MDISLSVIIPSYNGAHKLPNILTALEKQTIQDFETVLVVDGSTDNTQEVLESKRWQLQNLRVIYKENGGRAVARNTGAKEAKNELLIFFDDDMRPWPECIAMHLKYQQSYPQGLIAGPATSDPQKMTTDFLQFKLWAETKNNERFQKDFIEVSLDNYVFTSANLSVKRQVFWSLDGFDERLNDSEDFVLSMQAFDQNIPIYFLNKAKAWHDEFATFGRHIHRMNEYRRAKKQVLQMYPKFAEMHKASFQFTVSPIKKVILLFFRYNKIWAFFLNSILFKKLFPVSVRFKFYDVIIFASITKS
ncbi:hypothetical protein BKI52_04060 [marine bacterium AO1-C]|nr:hypothetical protein BKI52_04060 [marine bacterium AO1-C]